jgi:hypothetical protein
MPGTVADGGGLVTGERRAGGGVQMPAGSARWGGLKAANERGCRHDVQGWPIPAAANSLLPPRPPGREGSPHRRNTGTAPFRICPVPFAPLAMNRNAHRASHGASGAQAGALDVTALTPGNCCLMQRIFRRAQPGLHHRCGQKSRSSSPFQERGRPRRRGYSPPGPWKGSAWRVQPLLSLSRGAEADCRDNRKLSSNH